MKLTRITKRFLESLAEVVETLNIEPITCKGHSLIVLVALILTGAAAFSKSPSLSASFLALSFLIAYAGGRPLRPWIRIVLLTLGWVTLISIPLPFMTNIKSEAIALAVPMSWKVNSHGIYIMILFILRAVAAASIFTSIIYLIGWKGMLRGLEGLHVPREIILLLVSSIVNIPILLREMAKMMLAREARVFNDTRLKDLWAILATVLGGLIVKSYEHAGRAEKAISARSFSQPH
ncbi:MAG: energy-coupling factor transporter transmembrane component T [Candidatus Bathyarchaeia archaeon]